LWKTRLADDEFSTNRNPSPSLWKTPLLWRRRWYTVPGRQKRLARPVISVGNLGFGGRGKTPTVALLARLLVEAGERPAILSRGYARRTPDAGVVVTSDGVHLLADLDRSGDEPLLLARAVPGAAVLVCEDRALAGVLAERVHNATVHLLDDGFQHLQLARDLDLVIVGPGDVNGRAMPFGRLREPAAALSSADAILLDDESADGGSIEGLHSGASIFRLRRSLDDPVALDADVVCRRDRGSVVALAGIARPERFSRALAQAGWTVIETLTFPDHHRYTWRDVRQIQDVAERTQATVLTTTKDAMRLLPLRPLPVTVAAVPLQLSIEPADVFRHWLFDRLRQIRS